MGIFVIFNVKINVFDIFDSKMEIFDILFLIRKWEI